MKALIIGFGSIGKRHEANLRALGVRDFVYLHHEKSKKDLPHHYTLLRDALQEKPDCAVIANPTSLHMPIAKKLVVAGVHIFIEKPISHTMTGVEALRKEARKKKLVAMAGYNFRFHPQVKKIKTFIDAGIIGKILGAHIAVGQYLPDWHPGEDYRKSYAARADLGGGVILTLSHEIDYANWWFGKPKKVSALVGKISNLDINTEDVAEISVVYENGAFAHIHLDYIARPAFRETQILGSQGTIRWNYFTNELKVFSAKIGKWKEYPLLDFERNNMYVEEMQAFLKAIKTKSKPPITLDDGIAALHVALKAKKSGAYTQCLTERGN